MPRLKITPAFALMLILGAAALRLAPHYPNMTPLGAMALAGGAMMAGGLGLLMPLAAWFLSDLVINNTLYAAYYPGFVWVTPGMAWLYGTLVGVFLIGRWLGRGLTLGRGIGAVLASSTLFFLVSNLAVWLSSGMYTPDAAGLVACYVAALPFYLNTLMGDGLYSVLLFGLAFAAARYRPTLATLRA